MTRATAAAGGEVRLELCGLDTSTPTASQWALRCVVFGNVPERWFDKHAWDYERAIDKQFLFFDLRCRFLTEERGDRLTKISRELLRLDAELSMIQDRHIDHAVKRREQREAEEGASATREPSSPARARERAGAG